MNTVACGEYESFDINDLAMERVSLGSVVRAHEAIVRLDEQVGRSSIGRAWSERILFRQACDAQYAQGSLVHVDELVLLAGGLRRQPGYPELIDTFNMLQVWRRALDDDASELLRADRAGLNNVPASDPFPVLRKPVRLRGVLKAPATELAPVVDIRAREQWRRVMRTGQQLTPVLAAAVAWDCWMRLAPEPGSGWRATLLAALVLRSLGTAPSLLLPIDCGWRVSQYRVRPEHTREQRLAGFISWLEAAAREGRKEFSSLIVANTQLRYHLRSKRNNSRLPALARLFLSLPLVSVRLAARHIGCTPQAVEKMIPLLGSTPREVTARKRYRAWTVP